jgi:hypothetical protein
VREFDLEEPEYVTVTIDRESGLLAGPWCAGAVEAKFIKGKEPTETSTECVERERAVPDVTSLDEAAARQLLDDDGFTGVRVEQRLVSDVAEDGIIVAQDPPAGTKVGRGDPIVLYVGDDPFQDQ